MQLHAFVAWSTSTSVKYTYPAATTQSTQSSENACNYLPFSVKRKTITFDILHRMGTATPMAQIEIKKPQTNPIT